MGGGTCDDSGQCKCELGFAGAWCDTKCPSVVTVDGTVFCSGPARGTCSWGTAGTGQCECKFGYAGEMCELVCTGGAARPCGGHGTCNRLDASCSCHQDEELGFWEGNRCELCTPPYLPPNCDRYCPGAENGGLPCSGHGDCRTFTATCLCNRHHAVGFYDGPSCDRCAAGYFGHECRAECPGGACNACGGHGTCDDGTHGSGHCTCDFQEFFGFWAGTDCSVCAPGWFGVRCDESCPAYIYHENRRVAEVCSLRGTCDDGALGSGRCTCQNPEGEHWAGDACNDCTRGWYGDRCQMRCPGSLPPPQHCGGRSRGGCDDGPGGSGNCTCGYGWTGEACQYRCPRAEVFADEPPLVCADQGECIAEGGAAVCMCFGNRAPTSSCRDCIPGYWGEDCEHECPGGSLHSCSGRSLRGQCNRDTGACMCIAGWGGGLCDRRCPGGEVAPCSLHGRCRDDASCECWYSPTLGFWSGDDCSRCDQFYSGESCALPCPVHGGMPCGGHGTCFAADIGAGRFEARCSCADGYCGAECRWSGEACAAEVCPLGQYGVGCSARCPGLSFGTGSVCSAHGACDGGASGTGECICTAGFALRDCSADCGMCTQGTCEGGSDSQGVLCRCYSGWAGRWCDTECAGGFRDPCGGHGTCDDGALGTGLCTCSAGWRGEACTETCPTDAQGALCSGNGVCQQYGVACKCDQSAAGHWSGVRCESCSAGWRGSNCSEPCVNGVTRGLTCDCWSAWYGVGCTAACPGRMGNETDPSQPAAACGGHGTCGEGETGTGVCACEPGYHGDKCTTVCRVEVNCSKHRQASVVCGATGCECVDDAVGGHWAGTRCSSCKVGWWGGNCDQECRCNNHAYGCNSKTGLCDCWADADKGWWLSPDCQTCADGHTGITCTAREIAVTRIRSPPTLFHPAFKHLDTSFQLFDATYNRVIVCSTPPAVYMVANARTQHDVEASTNLQGYSRWGKILSAAISSDGEYVYFLQDNGGTTELVQAMRKVLFVLFAFPMNPFATTDGTVSRHADAEQAAPLPLAAVMRQQVFYTLYAFQGVLEIHASAVVASETEGATAKLLSRMPIASHLTTASSMQLYTDQWGVQRLVIVGTLHGKNDVLVLTPTESDPAQYAFFRLGESDPFLDIGTADTAELRLAEASSQRYLFVTSTEPSERGGRLTQLVVLRIDIRQALSFNGAHAEVLRAPVLEAEGNFAPASLRLSAESNTLFLVVKHQSTPASKEPSVLYKLDPTDFALTGNLRFGYYSGEAEAVVDLVPVPEARLGVALPDMPFMRLIELNDFAVSSVFPPFVDIAGGALVTATGSGFIPSDTDAWCFYLGNVIKAFNITRGQAVCRAPPIDTLPDNGGACDSYSLEVSILGKERMSSNLRTLRVVSAPTVVAVRPGFRRIGDNASTVITLTGYNIAPSPSLRCHFSVSPNSSRPADRPDTQEVHLGTVHWIDSTQATCNVPDLPPVSSQYFVTLTADGFYYPPAQETATLRVVGSPTGIRVARGINPEDAQGAALSWQPQMASDMVAPLPAVYVHPVDDSGNSGAEIDREARVVVAADLASCVLDLEDNSSGAVVEYAVASSIDGGTNVSMKNGVAVFNTLFIKAPRRGSCTLVFSVPVHDPPWTSVLRFVVVPGVLREIELIVPFPRDDFDPRVPPGYAAADPPGLMGPAALRGVDGGKNQVVVGRNEVLNIVFEDRATGQHAAEVLPVPAERIPELGTSEWVVELETAGMLFGKDYKVRFWVAGNPAVPPIYDQPILRRPCGVWRFAQDGQLNVHAQHLNDTCLNYCPEGGVCNGTTVIVARSTWWREPVTRDEYFANPHTLYQRYSTFHQCEKGHACLGGEQSECKEGYRGTLCDSCVAPDFASSGDECVSCLPRALAVLVTIGIIAGLLLLTVAFAHRAIMDNLLARRSLTFVFIKLFLSYLQTLAAVTVGDGALRWPSLLRDVMWAQTKLLTLHSSVSPFQCVAELTYYERFAILQVTPLVWLAAITVVLIPYEVYRRGRAALEAGDLDTIGNPMGTADADPADSPDAYVQQARHASTVPRRFTSRTRKSFVLGPAGEGWGSERGSDADEGAAAAAQLPIDPATKYRPSLAGSSLDSERFGDTVRSSPQATPQHAPLHVAEGAGSKHSPRVRLSVTGEPVSPLPPRPLVHDDGSLGEREGSHHSSEGGGFSPKPFYTGAPGALSPPAGARVGVGRGEKRGSLGVGLDDAIARVRSQSMSSAPSTARRRASSRVRRPSEKRKSLLRSTAPKGVDSSARMSAARASVVQEIFGVSGKRMSSKNRPSVAHSSGRRRSSRVAVDRGDLEKGAVEIVSRRSSKGLMVGRRLSTHGHLELVVDTGDDEDSEEFEEWLGSPTLGGTAASPQVQRAPASRWVDEARKKARAERLGAGEGVAGGGGGMRRGVLAKQKERPMRQVTTQDSGGEALERFVIAPIPNLMQGTGSEPVVVSVTSAPATAVRLTPICADEAALSFVPRSVLFTPTFTQGHISVMGWDEGEYIIAWKVSGPSAATYAEPDPVSVLIFGSIEISFEDILVTSWIVGFWLLHPLIVLACASMLQCTEISGNHYLTEDMDHECYTDEWYQWQYLNIACFLLWAVAVPGGLAAWMHVHRRELEEPDLRAKLGFLTRGLSQKRWYWEFYLTARKMALIFVTVFIDKLLYRLFLCQWLLFAALALHMFAKPFAHSVHHHVESVTLFVLAFTLNLGMYYFRDDQILLTEGEDAHLASDSVLYVVYVALLFGNLGVVVAMVALYCELIRQSLIEEGRHGLIESLDVDDDGEVTFAEVLVVMWRKRFGSSKLCQLLPCLRKLSAADEQAEADRQAAILGDDDFPTTRVATEGSKIGSSTTSGSERALDDADVDPWPAPPLPSGPPPAELMPPRSPDAPAADWAAAHASRRSLDRAKGLDPARAQGAKMPAHLLRGPTTLEEEMARQDWDESRPPSAPTYDRAADLGLQRDFKLGPERAADGPLPAGAAGALDTFAVPMHRQSQASNWTEGTDEDELDAKALAALVAQSHKQRRQTHVAAAAARFEVVDMRPGSAEEPARVQEKQPARVQEKQPAAAAAEPSPTGGIRSPMTGPRGGPRSGSPQRPQLPSSPPPAALAEAVAVAAVDTDSVESPSRRESRPDTGTGNVRRLMAQFEDGGGDGGGGGSGRLGTASRTPQRVGGLRGARAASVTAFDD
eukprot:TRINITY_DN11735_c1_g1_i1.p1 TRINITY_DN11735_c1_g1~~TRINITY_DN11735_c1_g1_i1.p1  ORF type:complete len:3416 (+),score=1007.02 TRINITY_DN11735_c1_g1_i1:698-10249(+)